MKKPDKHQRWVPYGDTLPEDNGHGVTRRILAYTDGLMCVENDFAAGAVGTLHSHPHTQITYVVSGKFAFSIDGEKRVVTAGDTLLKEDGVIHGCTCLESGKLLDIFTPMREDFVGD
ncbi:MAG: cupin domain-containing protein [Oscillospiraceae bacterium]|nr:cupin domain-containing protein [Oscillospiraceae bacterium]MBQ6973272.1 cupin domain-containing protein [Oscillospiraceae bacterium]MBQ7465374.1 cupin domain-containing protein [Oscillospiraceae bacterium]